ncbi:hypothetical protein [Sphingobium sp.]|uniref:hypothetical protein n=1 Tax=Sphingobium sp. TaxID=1912891 RepID=UPI003BB4D4FF
MKFAAICIIAGLFTGGPIYAQRVILPRDVVGAAIVSDIARDRQAEREARRYPYASPGQGNITSAGGARDACVVEARQEMGAGARLIGQAVARSMATGWEVEGHVAIGNDNRPFVCSVRNGSVSGLLLRP